MKRYVYLFFLGATLSVFNAKAQTRLMATVNDVINTLKQSGVDTIVAYHPYCVGCRRVYEETSVPTCHSFDKQYVLWKHKGESYLQLFDECYTYLPQKGAAGFIDLWTKNANVIMEEKILPVEIEKKINGKTEKFTIMIDHSLHRDFKFYLNGNIIEKRIDLFDLDTRWEDDFISANNQQKAPPPGKDININYEKNQKTYLKKLIDLAEQEIIKIKFEKAP